MYNLLRILVFNDVITDCIDKVIVLCVEVNEDNIMG